MNKHLVIWRAHSDNPIVNGFSHRPEYHIFFQKCQKVFELRFADIDSYLGGGVFQNVSKYEKGRIIPAENQFKADVIYQKSRIPLGTFDNAVKILDSVEFRTWCADKWNQYQYLGEYIQPTFLVMNHEDLNLALSKIYGSKAILKPRYGRQGRGIVMLKDQTPSETELEFLGNTGYILQEFVDTSGGIPNVVNGMHDIKLITMGNKIFANLRTPLPHSEICTFDSPYSEIPLFALPPEILTLHKSIKAKIDAKFPEQIYSIDLGMTAKGPVLFEVNGYTAFPFIHFSYADEFFESLIDKLKL